MEILTLIGTAVAIIISALSVFIALKKTKPEIRSIEANTDKTRAEIMRIYGEELLSLKEQYKKERKANELEIEELEKKVSDLSNQLNQQAIERREEKIEYREFINILLTGINKLTKQFQDINILPSWIPPTKTPFDCE